MFSTALRRGDDSIGSDVASPTGSPIPEVNNSDLPKELEPKSLVVDPSKNTFADYKLPSEVEGLLTRTELTTKNVVVMIHKEGQLLFGKRADSLDEGGTWSVVSGAIEDGEHPIDAGLREMLEETGDQFKFKSFKVITGRAKGTTGNIYILAELDGPKLDPQPGERHASENTAWQWAPAALCPTPPHPAIQETQELFFEHMPVHALVPRDGVLDGAHGTASWFKSFELDESVVGRFEGDGVYVGIGEHQAVGYSGRAASARGPLHGQYFYKLKVSTNIPVQGGFIGNSTLVDPELINRAINEMADTRDQDKINFRQKLKNLINEGKSITGSAFYEQVTETFGAEHLEFLCRLGCKGKWVPGFCYLAYDPKDINIVERVTIKPPASPVEVFKAAEGEMKMQLENSTATVSENRKILQWAGVLSDALDDQSIEAILKDPNRLKQSLLMLGEKIDSELMVQAHNQGLQSELNKINKMHTENLVALLGAIGGEDVRAYWKNHLPSSLTSKVLKLLESKPSLEGNAEEFLKEVRTLLPQASRAQEVLAKPITSYEFSGYYELAFDILWKEIGFEQNPSIRPKWLGLQDESISISFQARKVGELSESLRSYIDNPIPFNELEARAVNHINNQCREQNAGVVSTDGIGRIVLDSDSVYSERVALGAFSLALAEDSQPEIQSGHVIGNTESLQAWLNEKRTKGAQAAEKLAGEMVFMRDTEEAIRENRSRYIAKEEGRNRNKVLRKIEFNNALEKCSLTTNNPENCFNLARQTQITPQITLQIAEGLYRNWTQHGRSTIYEPEKRLNDARQYFSHNTARERVIEYADQRSIMERGDLHPSWTEEALDTLPKSLNA